MKKKESLGKAPREKEKESEMRSKILITEKKPNGPPSFFHAHCGSILPERECCAGRVYGWGSWQQSGERVKIEGKMEGGYVEIKHVPAQAVPRRVKRVHRSRAAPRAVGRRRTAC